MRTLQEILQDEINVAYPMLLDDDFDACEDEPLLDVIFCAEELA